MTGRKICLALSIGVIALWPLQWALAYLPESIYPFLYVFRSLLSWGSALSENQHV